MQKFIIVIPVYNAVDYIGKCLDSVLSQDYINYEVIVVDDHSADGTWDIIKKYPVNKYRQINRIGSGVANIKLGIKIVKPLDNDVIMPIDGDDWFANKNVLSHLNVVYQQDIWVTWGQYAPASGKYKNFCQPVTDPRTYRKSGKWYTSHLRTFKKWLWDKISDRDLRGHDRQYFKSAWDRAFMYPMIEMAGSHGRFINEVLYIYNDLNPMNDMKMVPKLGIEEANYLISKPEYKEL